MERKTANTSTVAEGGENTNILARINRLHKLYLTLTNQEPEIIDLNAHRQGLWYKFIKRGLKEHDLADGIKGLQQLIRKGQRNPSCLKLRWLSAGPMEWDEFQEDLGMFRSYQRAKKRQYSKGKADVLRATGRPDEPQTSDAKTPKEVMVSSKALAILQKWREEHPL